MVRTKQSQAISEEAVGDTPPAPKIRRRKLKTLADLSRFMSSLINDTRCGDVDPALASKLAYMTNILKSIISEADIETRLAALEKEMQK